MRVRVAGMAWLPKSEMSASAIVQIKKDLTILPKKPSYGGDDEPPPAPINCWSETMTELGVPRAYFFNQAGKRHDIDWEMTDGAFQTSFDSLLRQEGPYAEQAEAIAAIVGRFREFDGTQRTGGLLTGILRGTTGFGKTNTALAIIHRMRVPTLILVHKEFLFTQWVKRIERFLPGARVGLCRGKTCDYEGKDIVIAMAQSLAREDPESPERYPEEFYRHFGMMVLDEVHRVGAPTWAPIPQLFSAMYRLGLTATPRRKDGADKVFWWHLGDIVFEAKTETPKPHVRMVPHQTVGHPMLRKHDAPRGMVMKLLSTNKARNTKIVNELAKAMKSPAGRKVMVLSHFLDHLRELELEFRDRMIAEGMPDITTSFYVGEWFTGDQTLCLAKAKAPLEDSVRGKAIDEIYRHFRKAKLDADIDPPEPFSRGRKRGQPKGSGDTRCADTFDERKAVILYRHGNRVVYLDEIKDAGIIALAKDYDIAQKNSKEKKRFLTEEELHEAERARVIFATYQMCSEGIDIPAVDTIGLVTPMSDVEQSYGRGRRNCVPRRFGGEMSEDQCRHLCEWRHESCQGKPHPVAFDVVDVTVPMALRSKKYRLDFYGSIGAKVSETNG